MLYPNGVVVVVPTEVTAAVAANIDLYVLTPCDIGFSNVIVF